MALLTFPEPMKLPAGLLIQKDRNGGPWIVRDLRRPALPPTKD